ncbi:MAG: LLM class F420-dependent oxidoreductase [Acidimicrobiales bacterium]|jgi:probable F420-dependent oxidoreductase|nr:LLM class F420-dependent oxidoreductase [Acidimicrobiales bacterium]
MKFSVTFPIVAGPYDPAFLTGDAVIRFARAAEAAGFDAVSFTDHPAPTDRWLRAGGHDALDPFVALSYCAAVTERLHLIPNILVLPYRNPFVVAKAVASLDVLSGGRFILAVATGYLRGEYKALGVDFEERNALFDEALDVLQGIWTQDDFAYEGLHFEARGQTANPKPASPPPIWIGGNSKLSRRRVARAASGWKPFPADRTLATTARTLPLETADDLAGMLDELWVMVEAQDRDPASIDIAFGPFVGGDPRADDFPAERYLDELGELAALGVTWSDAGVPGDSLDSALEGLAAFGAKVISPSRQG